MTIDNAITIFHGLECNPLFSEKHFKAFDMAIAILEAWEKVKAEIDEQYDRVHPYNISCAEGLEMALDIIDKHLKEVQNNDQRADT